MKAVIQRVSRASVIIRNTAKRSIGNGLMILLGVAEDDAPEDARWMAKKITSMRIFEDENGKMNLSLLAIAGEALVVSQFTLLASTKKGTRPSFDHSAAPDEAISLYEAFVQELTQILGKTVPTGEFGASMRVEIVNEGPVTIILDSRNRV